MRNMFEIEVVSDPQYPDEGPSITIVARSGHSIIRLTPEDSSGILGKTPDAGRLDGQTSNGEFTLVWTATDVVMRVGKYGDGCGGTLEVTVGRHEDVDNSFATMLAAWQAVAC